MRALILDAAVVGALAAWPAYGISASAPIPITHVVIVMQENRSFDHYFGTFPGADGPPAGTCVPLDPSNPGAGCVAPFHDENDQNGGGPHAWQDAQLDIDDGIKTVREDGYVYQQVHGTAKSCQNNPNGNNCGIIRYGRLFHDAMGYHDQREIPNYWAYAENFVLQDHMFAGVRSWSWPEHLELVSEWVATCTDDTRAMSCRTAPNPKPPRPSLQLPWANLAQLLDAHQVSWKYYLGAGPEPDCEDDEMTCPPQIQTPAVPSYYNPLGYFEYVKQQGLAYLSSRDVPISAFLTDIKAGTLPQVSWIVPSNAYSEHPTSGVTAGMEYVTALVNAVMQSPYWRNTAIFITWDDWGGFYDHVPPPNVDMNTSPYPIQGFGIRVPGLMISAYAKHGYIDHAIYGSDSYATFFENLFTGSARLNPAQLGNPDRRPDIRDSLTQVTFPDGTTAPLGDMMTEFDFTRSPQPPLVLSTHIPTNIQANCAANYLTWTCTQATVQLTWDAVSGGAVSGPFSYHVVRNDTTDLAQCVTAATSCLDTPPSGTSVYRVYSVDAAGKASPLSAGATVVMK